MYVPDVSILTVLLLLLAFSAKHLICDFLLQGRYMIGKFLPYPFYIKPLLAHVVVHGIGTFAIAIFMQSFLVSLSLAVLDMAVHFVVDRLKASPDIGGRFKYLSAAEYKQLIQEESELAKIAPHSLDMTKVQARFKSNTYAWWSIGVDQEAHKITHYIIIVLLFLL